MKAWSKRSLSNTSMEKEKIVLPSMESRNLELLATIPVNGTYLLGVYKGSLSEYDILLKYRQKEGERWSRLRTPKHIHWAVDVLIKHYSEPKQTDLLLNHLLKIWGKTAPLKNDKERDALLNTEHLLSEVNKEAKDYPKLAGKGEYSVKFLILIAKLLMVQEKTNRNDAYMFKNLLEKLKDHKNIFEIVSAASFAGR